MWVNRVIKEKHLSQINIKNLFSNEVLSNHKLLAAGTQLSAATVGRLHRGSGVGIFFFA